jgi:hypothetical protein
VTTVAVPATADRPPSERRGSTVPGRTRVTARALTRVIAALTAEELGVQADHVHVDLDDDEGALAATLRTPIGVAPLRVDAPGPSLTERCAAAQQHLRERVPVLTGRRLSRVSVHLTGAVIGTERRVR